MSKWNRYKFAKNLFKETIVLFESNNKLSSMGADKLILNYIGFKFTINSLKKLDKFKINYIIFDNLDIVKHISFLDNNYNFYYMKIKVIDLYKYMIKRLY